MTVKITDNANFSKDVLESDKTVMIDFWAEWCGPCRALAPVLEEVSEELSETAVVYKINVDENHELAQKYGVRGIPTLIVFKGGHPVKTSVGMQSKDAIKQMIDEK